MIRFNKFPPEQMGDVELTELGKKALRAYAAHGEPSEPDAEETSFQELRGAVEAISSTVVANSPEISLDKLNDIIDILFDDLCYDLSAKAEHVVETHSMGVNIY